MKLEMKRLKKEKLHLLKKSGGGTIVIDKNADGDREATIELVIGGLKPELLQLKASPLFEKIKVKLSATQTGEALEDAAAAESEIDTTENLPEDNLDDVDADADEGEEDNKGETASETKTASELNSKKESLKENRAAKLAMMIENVGKMEKALGTTSKDKLEPNLLKYEAALEQLIKAAQADGVIEKEEQASIVELKTALENLRKSMDENNATPQGKKLTEEQKVKIKENMEKINARLAAIAKNLGIR
jgi:hypothetical protein